MREMKGSFGIARRKGKDALGRILARRKRQRSQEEGQNPPGGGYYG